MFKLEENFAEQLRKISEKWNTLTLNPKDTNKENTKSSAEVGPKYHSNAIRYKKKKKFKARNYAKRYSFTNSKIEM